MPEHKPTPAEENLQWLLDTMAGKAPKPPSTDLLEAMKGLRAKPMRRSSTSEEPQQKSGSGTA